MELLKEKIEAFLNVDYCCGVGYGRDFSYGKLYGYGYGVGCGDGDGRGYGNGYGVNSCCGYSVGYGFGYGIGNSNGYGEGSGCSDGGYSISMGLGYGIKELNGKTVYKVDNIPTIIESVKGDYAKGYTIRNNVKLVPCYVAKVGKYFAHGSTLEEAIRDAQKKYDMNKPLEERIADTIKKYPTLDTKVSHKELYDLHHTLTGSCKFGRDEFARAHNLDPDKGEMTMREFIDLTKGAYGGDAIRRLENTYNKK